MKRFFQALAVLLLLGIAKMPLEQSATCQFRAAGLLSEPMDLGMRDNLSQMGFAAALGGLRSLVATITYLQAYHEWENVNWAKVDSLLQLTTSLQPSYANYWDDASWQMAYNAASYYLYDEKLQPMVRGRLYEEHVRRGIDILKDGLRHLPDDARLWNSLAEIYERRSHEPELAAQAYLEVFRISRNSRYRRFAAYQYAQSAKSEFWRKAYDLLHEAYQDPRQRTPSLIDTLKTLEDRLGVPTMKRIPDARRAMEVAPTELGPIR